MMMPKAVDNDTGQKVTGAAIGICHPASQSYTAGLLRSFVEPTRFRCAWGDQERRKARGDDFAGVVRITSNQKTNRRWDAGKPFERRLRGDDHPNAMVGHLGCRVDR